MTNPNVVEPFVFGKEGNIISLEDAERVLHGNAYYFYFAGMVAICGYLVARFIDVKIPIVNDYLILGAGLTYLIAGFSLTKWHSRVGAVVGIALSGSALVNNVLISGIGVGVFVSGILVFSAFRALKAARVYFALQSIGSDSIDFK